MKFRALKANEIEVRVANITEKKCTLLLYKDARCDMNILDETVGADNWQRRHYDCKGNLFCSVGIMTGKEWVWKDDCGAESFTEKEKGEASDSFKRACVNWGIGRELYTAPRICFDTNKITIYQDKKTGKPKTYDRFFVKKISYDESGKINGICIEKETENGGVRVFVWYDESISKKTA